MAVVFSKKRTTRDKRSHKHTFTKYRFWSNYIKKAFRFSKPEGSECAGSVVHTNEEMKLVRRRYIFISTTSQREHLVSKSFKTCGINARTLTDTYTFKGDHGRTAERIFTFHV